MRYDNQKLADMLAADYVLGTLKGAARRRYEHLLKRRTDWAEAHIWWESHIHLLADTVPAVQPPGKVWQNIQTRLFKANTAKSSPFWKSLAFLSTALAASFATFLIMQSPKQVIELEPAQIESVQVALLANDKTQAGWLLSLTKNNQGESEIRAKSLASLETKPDNAFELWLLPADKSTPISLGLLPQQGNAVVKVTDEVALLLASSGLAVSLEPLGGSPTGQPTGAVLYQGKLTQI